MNEKANLTFINEPTECPSCGSNLVKINDQLFCKNTSCPAQINKKLEHFCKTLKIKGIGPKTAEKLNIQELSELFYLDWNEVSGILGEKTADKLKEEVDKAKNSTLDLVLAALSIPLIGSTASQKIANVVSHISEINEQSCKLAGLGEKATNNLLDWLNTEGADLIPFLPFSFKSDKGNTQNKSYKTVCITGKLSSFAKKADAEEVLAEAGYKLVDSVTKTLDILIDEGDGTSSKRKLADKYGIRVITNLKEILTK